MLPLPSPRLPGVVVLRPEATGPEYARWRREVKAVFIAKGTWGHCDGTSPMPMPEAGPNFFSPAAPTNLQPGLLEDRKAWMKKDRDVKLDLFLSVADDIKLDVFEVGPPNPPISFTAKEMMEALDMQFDEFKFEDYHHVFCHFLNLHIDQYANIEDFNAEFQATLDDLMDHGHPMSNIQACSAYFSKLRCTQNPWVAKKLKEWDGLELETPLEHLMRQSPPWSTIRPLTATSKPASSHHSFPDSIPEEHLEDTPHHSDNEYAPSEHSVFSTTSSNSSNSPKNSTTKPTYSHTRDFSVMSQEITVHASFEDLSDLGTFPSVPMMPKAHTELPKRVSSMQKQMLPPAPPPINRPLPALPPNRSPTPSSQGSRSASPVPSVTSIDSGKSRKRVQLPVLSQLHSIPGMESAHPVIRSPLPPPRSVPEDIHPALRGTSPRPTTPNSIVTTVVTVPTPAGRISDSMRSSALSPPIIDSPFLVSSPRMSLFPAPPKLTDFPRPPRITDSQRPSSSRSAKPSNNHDFSIKSPPILRIDSNNSSTMSLPLQDFSPDDPEFRDTLVTEGRASMITPPPLQVNKMQQAKMRFEGVNGRGTASPPPRGLSPPITEEEKNNRKRSWSIKASWTARHGIKEII